MQISGGQHSSLGLYIQIEVSQPTTYDQIIIACKKTKLGISCIRNCNFLTVTWILLTVDIYRILQIRSIIAEITWVWPII